MTHVLKIRDAYFEEIRTGKKRFEVRRYDRPYTVGDRLRLRELTADGAGYTGREQTVRVLSMLKDAQFCKDGYCIMSIEKEDEA